MDTRNFSKNVAFTFCTELAIHLLNFATTILIVRALSPSDFGIFTLFISFSLSLCYLTSIGLPQAIIYFIGKRKEHLDMIFGLSLSLFLFVGSAVVTGGYLSRQYPLNSFLRELPHYYFFPLLILYFFSLLDSFLLSIIRGLKDFFLFNLRRLLTPAGTFLSMLLLYFSFGLTLRLAVIILLTVTALLTAWFFIKVLSITSFKLTLDWPTIKSFIGYGSKSYFQILAGHLIYQVDLYIIAYLLSAKEVAFYSVAVLVATLLWYIPNTVGFVLFPTLSSEDDEKKIHTFSTQVCRHTLLITFLGAICLGLVGKYLILFFYGTEYARSVNAMLIILPGVVIMSIYKVLTRNFSSRNRQHISIMAAGAALAVNIFLNFIWIPKHGIEGAALASTISYTLAAVILVIRIKIESNIPIRKMLFVDCTDLKFYTNFVSRIRKTI